MEKHGHGKYEPLETSLLPRLHLVFADNPSDSGKVRLRLPCHGERNTTVTVSVAVLSQ